MTHLDKAVAHAAAHPSRLPNVLPHSIFVHVPKTGGTWIREHFNEQGWWEQLGYGHLTVDEIRQGWPEYNDRPTWCVVRHPVAIIKSHWAFALRQLDLGLIKPSTLCHYAMAIRAGECDNNLVMLQAALYGMWSPDLNLFVSRLLNKMHDYVDRLYQYFTHKVDKVIKLENMPGDLLTVLNGTGDLLVADADKIRSWKDKRNASYDGGQMISDHLANRILVCNPWTCKKFDYGWNEREFGYHEKE